MMHAIVGLPVDEKIQLQVRKTTYVPEAGSQQKVCECCNLAIWITPAQIEFLKDALEVSFFCMFCAKTLQKQSEISTAVVVGKGNKPVYSKTIVRPTTGFNKN